MAEFETMNMYGVNIDTFVRLIKEQIEDEDYKPIIGIGKSGIGKTECIKQLTDELGIGFRECRLVTLTETDMLGIPEIVEIGRRDDGSKINRTNWASNDLFPDLNRDGDRGILVLDEITSAVSTVRAAAYQLLDSKRSLGNYTLPEHWLVVALGNGIDDGGVYSGMESAFLNRANCLRVEPDLPTFRRWAIKQSVNSSVLAYLSFAPEQLHILNPDQPVAVFPSPRSWFGLSRKLNDRERRNSGKPLREEDIALYASAAVGRETGFKFSAFYQYNRKTVSTEDILNGKIMDDNEVYETQVIYLMIQSVTKELSSEINESKNKYGRYTDTVLERAGNACSWFIKLSRDVSLDMAIMAVRDICRSIKGFDEIMLDKRFDKACPSFAIFAHENSLMFERN